MQTLKTIIALTFILLINTAAAESVSIDSATITRIEVYSEYRGDIVIHLNKELPTCKKGFWLSPMDDGFDSILRVALSAYHAKSSVIVYARNDLRWAAHPTIDFCKLSIIGLQ